jgi:hypothetical protein
MMEYGIWEVEIETGGSGNSTHRSIVRYRGEVYLTFYGVLDGKRRPKEY